MDKGTKFEDLFCLDDVTESPLWIEKTTTHLASSSGMHTKKPNWEPCTFTTTPSWRHLIRRAHLRGEA